MISLGKIGGVTALVLGFLAIIGGVTAITTSQEERDLCFDFDTEESHQKPCSWVRLNYFIYWALIFTGIFLLVAGIVLIRRAKAGPPPVRWYTCQWCHNPINSQSSPTNCYICGAPIDWSGAEAERMRKERMATIGAFVILAGIVLFFLFHWLAIVIIVLGIIMVAEKIRG